MLKKGTSKKFPLHTGGGYSITVPPWERDLGDEVHGAHWKTYASQAWELRCSEINLTSVIADFYLLDALSSHVMLTTPGIPMNPLSTGVLDAMVDMMDDDDVDLCPTADGTIAGIQARAAGMFAALLSDVTPAMLAYLQYAQATELRFHSVFSRMGGSWDDSGASWKVMTEKFGVGQCARWAAEVFRDEGWGDSYGGESWAEGCDVVAAFMDGTYHGMPFGRREMLDRAFSLEHNTGTYLNKQGWKCGLDGLQGILDAHHESDWEVLIDNASSDVVELTTEYWKLCNGLREEAGVAPEEPPYGLDIEWVAPKEKMTLKSGKKVDVDSDLLKKAQAEAKKMEAKQQVNLPPVKKIMSAKFPGKCKVSGKSFPVGTAIVWHGKGKGASILADYEEAIMTQTVQKIYAGDNISTPEQEEA